MSVEMKQKSSLTAVPVYFKEASVETFSANYVIHAYEQGLEKGKRDIRVGLVSDAQRQFIKNRDYVVETAFSLVAEMISDGIDIKRGWIRAELTSDFHAIIGVPRVNYNSTDFDKYFIKAHELENFSNSEDMHLNIGFLNSDKWINEQTLFSDGFELKFEVQMLPNL